MSRAGLRLYGAGEAVGEASTVGTVIAEFLQSPSHRAILLGRYRWAGIGVSRTNGALLVTVDLAR
jgi:uncharacterized protein YkwD